MWEMFILTHAYKTVQRAFEKRLFFSELNHGKRKLSSLWVPDYLALAESKYPEYPLTNIQIKGLDYAILENFQSKIHWLAKRMNLRVSDAWAQELQKFKVIRFKPKTDICESEYIIKVYERNIQLSDVFGHQLPMFIDLITNICPPGVKVHVHEHTLAHHESRFVPDYKILKLNEQLEAIGEKK